MLPPSAVQGRPLTPSQTQELRSQPGPQRSLFICYLYKALVFRAVLGSRRKQNGVEGAEISHTTPPPPTPTPADCHSLSGPGHTFPPHAQPLHLARTLSHRSQASHLLHCPLEATAFLCAATCIVSIKQVTGIPDFFFFLSEIDWGAIG